MRRLRQRFTCLVDGVTVIALNGVAQPFKGGFHSGPVGRVHLVAVLVQHLFRCVCELVRVIARLDLFAPLFIF